MQFGRGMYSKARIAGHPIHPMLVGFPIALYVATVATMLIYVGTRDAFWYRAALTANVGGVIGGLLAAIPGAIDLFSLPATSRARQTGKKHAGMALLTTGLYSVSGALMYFGWTHRTMVDGAYALDVSIPLAIAVIGVVTVVITGGLGWALVQTHHVGIKPAHIRANRPSREPELDTLPTQAAYRPLRAGQHVTQS